MTSLSGLDSALSGLRLAQQQMNVISSNISNVSTEGYTRKLLPQSAVVAAGETVGVLADTTLRNVNLNLARDFWTQVSSTNFVEVQVNYLNKIQQFHGPPDSELSIAAKISNLRDSFLMLSNTPDDIFLIQNAVSIAKDAANKINEFSDLLTNMRNDAQDRIEEAVARVNSSLLQISDLNKQIKGNTNVGKTTASLEDQRDIAIKAIAEELEISFFVKGDGVMVVQTSDGIQLADEGAETLYFQGTPLGPESVYFDPNNPNNSASGLFVGGNPALNRTAFDITNREPNGTIGGLLELRDRILPEHYAQLDELAHKLASRFEAQGIRLFTDSSGRVPSNSVATMQGSADLIALGGGGALSTAGGATYTAGVDDVFTINIDPNGVAPQILTISLSAAEANFGPPSPQSLVDEINAQASLRATPLNDLTASLDSSNQLVIKAAHDIFIDASGPGEMGSDGLNTLGMVTGLTTNEPTQSPFEPTPYVGFASDIRVNKLILNDNTLIRESTLYIDIQDGSNEFLRRATDYVFGRSEFQLAYGQLQDDLAHPFGISVSNDPNPAADTLQEAFGFASSARIVSSVDIVSLAAGGPLSTAPGNPFLPTSGPPLTDSFTITFDPTGGSGGPQVLNIDLSTAEANFPALSGDQALISEINAQISALAVPFDTAIASINTLGQLVLDAQFDINIDASFAGEMGSNGLSYLGLQSGTTLAELPSFDIQIGQGTPVTVTVAAGDTEIDLLAKLNAIPGVEASIGTGPNPPGVDNIFIRPGDGFGGDLKLFSGSIRSATDDTILEALFGAPYPVVEFNHPKFNENNLGPGANIIGSVRGASNIITFSQKMISAQSETAGIANARLKDEVTFRDLVGRQLLDESGVNLEEELSQLILIQTAFSASARTVQAIDEMFQDLLDSI